MADLVFAGLKLAYKAFKAYSDVKSELGEFEEDFEELEMRLQALDPVMNALEGKLTDELTIVLTIAKREQEKANAYTKELFDYCRRFKESGSKFKAIATALASKAVDSLPDGLREGAQALMPVVAKHGVPEKAYAKFAEKLHFLMSSLSAAAATQALQGPNAKGAKSSAESAPPPAVTTLAEGSDSKEAEVKTLSAEEQAAMMSDMVKEMVEEDEAPFRAILLKRFIASQTYVFALWVDKVPHILMVGYSFSMPVNLQIMRAPSTKFLVDLSQNGLPRRFKWMPESLQLLIQKTTREGARELRIGECSYSWNHTRTVTNKWFFAMFLFPPLLYCSGCLFKTLQMRDFKLNGKVYNVKIQNTTMLYVNDELLLDTRDLGYGGGCC